MATILKLLVQKFDNYSPYKPTPQVVYLKKEHYLAYKDWLQKRATCPIRGDLTFRGSVIKSRT